MNSMNAPPKSKCPFCGEETLPFEIRGELAGQYGARYWEDFHRYKCPMCNAGWEINVKTAEREITQTADAIALKRLKTSKGTVFWAYKYNPGFQHERNTSREKEEHTMKVSYNGFTGELVKLERKPDMKMFNSHIGYIYDLSIYDSGKQVTHSFTGAKLEDVKFLGWAVSFQ